MSCWIALNQAFRCNIFCYNRTGGNHCSSADDKPRQYDGTGSDGSAVFNDRFQKFRWKLLASRELIVGEGGVRSNKYIISNAKTVP